MHLFFCAKVHKVFPSGLAAQEGTIQKGDEVLSINGKTLRSATHADATAALRQARNLKLAVVVICKPAGEGGREEGGSRREEPNPEGDSHSYLKVHPDGKNSLFQNKKKTRLVLVLVST